MPKFTSPSHSKKKNNGKEENSAKRFEYLVAVGLPQKFPKILVDWMLEKVQEL